MTRQAALLLALTALASCALVEKGQIAQKWREFKDRGHFAAKYGVPSPTTYTGILDQKLDHFDRSNPTTFPQQYGYDATFWNGTGPVFLYIFGEGPADFTDEFMALYQWAQPVGALIVGIEHRYYGDSNPLDFNATDPSTYKYLGSEQALADMALFVAFIKGVLSIPESSPWITFGCSYAGAMSTFFRIKYPHLVVGSVAGSAVVHAQRDFFEYAKNFPLAAGDDCIQSLTKATTQINSMISTQDGRTQLGKLFTICQSLEDETFRNRFLWTIMITLASQAQSNGPGNWIVNGTCAMFTNSSDPLSTWASFFNQGGECYDLSQTLEEDYGGPWAYQKCTEFGFFKSSYKKTSPWFPSVDVDFIEHELCGFWGFNVTGDQDWTNQYFGGRNLKHTSNVLFTNGKSDPWHWMSILRDVSPSITVSFYSAGHCWPFYPQTDEDPIDLLVARARVGQYVQDLVEIYS